MTSPEPAPTPDHIELTAWEWPEIGSTSDLGALTSALPDLRDGDVVVITSKVVSKAEGRVSSGAKADVVRADTRRVVARRGDLVIAETGRGLVLAAAGVDTSNVGAGRVLSLPLDPDATARRIREDVVRRTSNNVAVIITDTAGRAWREGHSDLAIGCAGLDPLIDLRGHLDADGQVLQVTAPAIADEIAAAADLVKGKVSRRPVAVVRGLAGRVLPVGRHGPGAAALVRPAGSDLFGHGARDAVEVAVRRDSPGDLSHFPSRIAADPEPFASLACDHPDVRVGVSGAEAVQPHVWTLDVEVRTDAGTDAWLAAGRTVERAETLAAAHRLQPFPAHERHSAVTGWHAVVRLRWIVA